MFSIYHCISVEKYGLFRNYIRYVLPVKLLSNDNLQRVPQNTPMSHKFYESWHSFIMFCRTTMTFNQPYQLNSISMIYNLKVPAYEFATTIKNIIEGSG